MGVTNDNQYAANKVAKVLEKLKKRGLDKTTVYFLFSSRPSKFPLLDQERFVNWILPAYFCNNAFGSITKCNTYYGLYT